MASATIQTVTPLVISGPADVAPFLLLPTPVSLPRVQHHSWPYMFDERSKTCIRWKPRIHSRTGMSIFVNKGANGAVFLANEFRNDHFVKMVAQKRIQLPIVHTLAERLEGVEKVQREIQYHHLLTEKRIPYSVGLRGYWQPLNVDKLDENPVFEIFYDYYPLGDCFTFLEKHKPFSEGTCRRFLSNLLDSVTDFYKLGHVHRDLSLENLLVVEVKESALQEVLLEELAVFKLTPVEVQRMLTPEVYEQVTKLRLKVSNIPSIIFEYLKISQDPLADDGFLYELRITDYATSCGIREPPSHRTQELAGAINRISPEHWFSRDRRLENSLSNEIWQLILNIAEMRTFTAVYNVLDNRGNHRGLSIRERMNMKFTESYWTKIIDAFLRNCSSELSSDLKDLIRKCLVVDPKTRLTVQEIWDHPWMQPRVGTKEMEEEESDSRPDLDEMWDAYEASSDASE